MTCYGDQLACLVHLGPVPAVQLACFESRLNIQHGIDAGIAGDSDAIRRYTFLAKIRRRSFRRSEVQIR